MARRSRHRSRRRSRRFDDLRTAAWLTHRLWRPAAGALGVQIRRTRLPRLR